MDENKSASRWKRLADEAEETGDFALASKYHQERLVQEFQDPHMVCTLALISLQSGWGDEAYHPGGQPGS